MKIAYEKACPRCKKRLKSGQLVMLVQLVHRVGEVHIEITEKTGIWAHVDCPKTTWTNSEKDMLDTNYGEFVEELTNPDRMITNDE